jgi:hypothetical protein
MDDLDKDEHIHDRETQKKLPPQQPLSSSNSVFSETSDKIRTSAWIRSLNSKEPVHILLVGPQGQAKTLFLKCIFETFRQNKAFFTVGGNASKSGMIDVLILNLFRFLRNQIVPAAGGVKNFNTLVILINIIIGNLKNPTFEQAR